MTMPGEEILAMAARVRALMHQRLGARGHTLTEAVASRGACLPRRLRPAADALADAAQVAPAPKLARQADLAALRAHEAELVSYLRPLGRRARFMHAARNATAAVALGLVVLGALVIWALVWRGYL